MKLAEALTEPWAITEECYSILSQFAQRGLDAHAGKQGLGSLLFPMPSAPTGSDLDVREDGLAVIPVRGALTRRAWWPGDRASYEWIGERLAEALERSDVQRIALEVDSPGGQVNGTEELAAQIHAARGVKPIEAVVLGQAASAAYWIASSASRVRAGRTSLLGSIGVIWTFLDWSKYDERVGLREISIVSSQSPDKNIDPAQADGRARIQATVDHMAGIFVADVARNRGVSEATVISDFGRGWVLVGEQAVSAGLADAIGSIDDVFVDGASEEPAPKQVTDPASSGGEGEAMDTVKITDITAALLEQHCPNVVAQLRQEGAKEAATAQGVTTEQAVAEARAQAQAAERERILAIQEAGRGTGQAKLVAELVADSTVTVESAKARLFEATRAKAQAGLDALAGDEQDLNAPDPVGGDEGDAAIARGVAAAGDYVQKIGGIR